MPPPGEGANSAVTFGLCLRALENAYPIQIERWSPLCGALSCAPTLDRRLARGSCWTSVVDEPTLLEHHAILSHPPLYMPMHMPELNERMRGILVDWLCELTEELRLVPQTLHIAVALLDHLSSRPGQQMDRNNYQLIGCACLLVASQREDPYVGQGQGQGRGRGQGQGQG